MSPKMMKGTLFVVILLFFAAATIITLLGITGVIKVPESYLTPLFIAFIIELAGAVFAIVKGANFFDEPELDIPPVTQTPTGSASQSPTFDIRLEAADATLHGATLQYEGDERQENIGYWSSLSDSVSWTFYVSQPTSLYIVVEQACDPKAGGGGEYVIQCGAQKLTSPVFNTGSWLSFVRVRVGRITITKAGTHTIVVQPSKIPNSALMNLRRLILH